MATIQYEVPNNVQRMTIGVQGENKVREFLFDVTEWRQLTGNIGAAEMVVQRNGDASPYAAAITMHDENTVSWVPTSTDTAKVGAGKLQLMWIAGGQTVKTKIFDMKVDKSLEYAVPDTSLDPWASWMPGIINADANYKGLTSRVDDLQQRQTSPYNFKGAVATLADLPSTGQEVNDTYYVEALKYRVTWTGEAWQQSSMEESKYTDELAALRNDLDNSTYRVHPNYPATANHSIEDINEYGSFWLSTAYFTDLPRNTTGLLINDACGRGYILQTYMPQNLRFVLRRTKKTGSSGTTSNWTELVPSDETIASLIASEVESSSKIYQSRGTATSADDLFAEGTYYVPSSTITDITQLPVDSTGMVQVFDLNYAYVVQVFWTIYGYAKYYRYLAKPDHGGTTSNWKKISPLEDLRVITFGDSITAGYRNNGKGYIGLCNVRDYKNAAHSGDSLANLSGRGHVYSQLTASSSVINYKADVVIISGGFNDYNNSAPLGDMPSAPVTNDTAFESLDDTTVSGGLQKALYLGIKQYPDAQKAFLTTHRTSTYPYTKCSAGYTQEELMDFIKAICRLYGYVVIDIFNESSLNTAFDCYVSPKDYPSPTEEALTVRYAVNSDRVHPLQYGYVNYYVPLVNRFLQTCTRKMADIPF